MPGQPGRPIGRLASRFKFLELKPRSEKDALKAQTAGYGHDVSGLNVGVMCALPTSRIAPDLAI